MATGNRLTALRSKLEQAERDIAAHPLSSESVKTAQALVDARSGEDPAAIDRELSALNLPTLAELGKIQVQGTWSWWKLHRARDKLTKKIQRLS